MVVACCVVVMDITKRLLTTMLFAVCFLMMSSTNSKSDPEGAVRQYLLFVDDPSKLRDETEIQKKTQAVLDAIDPIDKLKALSELERVANVDEAPLRAAFVDHAKAWAAEVGVPVSAFRELKVSDEVLRAAGFDVPATPRRAGRGKAAGFEAPRQRAKAVPADEIKKFVMGLTGTFVLADVQNDVGGSPATVRKAVEELVEAGDVTKVGPMTDYQGRGRAPIQYSRG
jgi:hypothetical protein